MSSTAEHVAVVVGSTRCALNFGRTERNIAVFPLSNASMTSGRAHP